MGTVRLRTGTLLPGTPIGAAIREAGINVDRIVHAVIEALSVAIVRFVRRCRQLS
jgi:hypothetical protein